MNWADFLIVVLLVADLMFWLGAWARQSGEESVKKDSLTRRVEWLESRVERLRDDVDELGEDLDELDDALTRVERDGRIRQATIHLLVAAIDGLFQRHKQLDAVVAAHIDCDDAHEPAEWEDEDDDGE
jgi:chromosome segregation ATPase